MKANDKETGVNEEDEKTEENKNETEIEYSKEKYIAKAKDL